MQYEALRYSTSDYSTIRFNPLKIDLILSNRNHTALSENTVRRKKSTLTATYNKYKKNYDPLSLTTHRHFIYEAICKFSRPDTPLTLSSLYGINQPRLSMDHLSAASGYIFRLPSERNDFIISLPSECSIHQSGQFSPARRRRSRLCSLWGLFDPLPTLCLSVFISSPSVDNPLLSFKGSGGVSVRQSGTWDPIVNDPLETDFDLFLRTYLSYRYVCHSIYYFFLSNWSILHKKKKKKFFFTKFN